jgi:hypothetical protein
MQQETQKAQKREAREKEEIEHQSGKVKEMKITEFWKPHQTTLRFFEEISKE